MKIGIDVDGILADFVATFLPVLNKYCDCKIDDIIDFNFKHNTDLDDDAYKALWEEHVETDNIYKELRAIDGSSDTLNSIAQDHHIVLISSRPADKKATTENWLEQHGFMYDELVIVGRDIRQKVQVMRTCDLVVEDDLNVARMVSAKGIPVILMDYPWNRIPDTIFRVADWRDAGVKITKLTE